MKRVGIWIIVLIAGVLFIAGMQPVRQAESAELGQQMEAVRSQWNQLVEFASKSADGPLEAVIKWQGEWETGLTPQQAAEQISNRLGLESPVLTSVQDHPVYQAKGVTDNGDAMNLSIIAREKTCLYVVLRIEAKGDQQQLVGLSIDQERAGSILQGEGALVHWNGAIQAYTEGKGNKNQSMKDEQNNVALSQMEKVVTQLSSKPEPLDLYKDESTISRSYHIPSFVITLPGNDQKKPIALQMAAHKDPITGRTELSWGSPMLTIEY